MIHMMKDVLNMTILIRSNFNRPCVLRYYYYFAPKRLYLNRWNLLK